MGCGASVDKASSAAVVNPGELRDRSLPQTVIIESGVAQAGAANVTAYKPATTSAAPASQPAPASAIPPPSRPAAAATPRPASASAPVPRPPSAAAAASARPASTTAPASCPTADAGAGAASATAAALEAPQLLQQQQQEMKAVQQEEQERQQQQQEPQHGKQQHGEEAPQQQEQQEPQQQEVQQEREEGLEPQSEPAAAAAPPQPRMVDCAVSLRFLMDFCARVPEDMPTWKVVTDVIVPETRDRRCRYVEMIDPRDVGRCDYFISHRWATPFSHLVRYVKKHLVELGDVREAADADAGADAGADTHAGDDVVGGKAADAGREGPEEAARGAEAALASDGAVEACLSADQVFVWCDIFAINQHPGQTQADDLSQLKDCVEASRQTLLCLDGKGMVLTRIWCLYEIWNTVLAGGAPKLAVLGYDVDQNAFKEVYITLDVAEAAATVESDRVRILRDIEESTGLQELNLVIKKALVESTQAEAENAQKVLLPAAKDWKDFQRVMEAVNKHTQMLTAVGRFQESARYGYLIQGISDRWQKSQQQQQQQQQQQATASASGAAAAAAAAAAAGGSSPSVAAERAVMAGTAGTNGAAAAAALPQWHWSSYPRDTELRQVVDRAQAAEKGGRFDGAMTLYRDAVTKALKKQQEEQEQEQGNAGDATTASSLDLAGCRLHLGVFLASRGFIEQACTEEGEPAARLFQEAAGGDSLLYASAAYQAAAISKHASNSKELRMQWLGDAFAVQEAKLGPMHPATIDTLRERAEMTYMSGDFPAGVQIFHAVAVRLSGGRDLLQLQQPVPPAAMPPSPSPSSEASKALPTSSPSLSAPHAAAGGSAVPAASTTAMGPSEQLSAKAIEVWYLLSSYLGNLPGREDDCLRLCRALIPHKRRDYIRRLVDAVASGGEYADTAAAELRRMQLLPRPTSPFPQQQLQQQQQQDPAAAWEPEGLGDPDDPRVDCVGHLAELVTWSTALAKKGAMEAAVRLQWRIAQLCRNNAQMGDTEMQLPTGKVKSTDAYERCLLLDLSVPGVARVAARMLVERQRGDASSDATATAATTATAAATAISTADTAAGGTEGAAVMAAPALASADTLTADTLTADGATGAGAHAESKQAEQSEFAAPESYLELIQKMGRLWAAQDFPAAEAVCRRLVGVQSAGHGPVSKEVVEARKQLASLLANAGRQEEGEAEMRAALATHEQILAGKDPTMSQTLQSLAHMLEESNRGEAEQLYRRAVALVEKVHGPDHLDVGMALVSLGSFLMSDYERLAEGQETLNRGLAVQQKFQEQQAAATKAF